MKRSAIRVFIPALLVILAAIWIIVGFIVDRGSNITGRAFIFAGILALVLSILLFLFRREK